MYVLLDIDIVHNAQKHKLNSTFFYFQKFVSEQEADDFLLVGFPSQKANPFREKSSCSVLWRIIDNVMDWKIKSSPFLLFAHVSIPTFTVVIIGGSYCFITYLKIIIYHIRRIYSLHSLISSLFAYVQEATCIKWIIFFIYVNFLTTLFKPLCNKVW